MEKYTRDKDVSELQTRLKLSQKEYEILKTDLEIAQIQLQEANDTLNGGITPRNMANFRNTYVINASDSLDDTHPMYVYFRVLDETVKIVSVEVSYWIHNYRAYSKAAAAGGGTTTSATGSAAGGGSTSGGGGGQTSTANNRGHQHNIQLADASSGLVVYWYNSSTLACAGGGTPVVSTPNQTHTHTVANHTHTTPSHTHPTHTHTISNHTHDADYGIYEEENTPIIKFSVSQDDGVAYGQDYGNVPINRELIDITSDVTKTGSKILKFESTTRTRLTVQVEVKVDISVR